MPDNKNSKIIPFAFDENLIRTVTDESGNIWFVAKDVCKILEIINHRDATSQLDEDEKNGVGITDAMGRTQQVTVISESGLYALVFRSRKQEARAFSKWVRAEVLPTLRKTGSYSMPGAAQGVGAPTSHAMPDVPEMYHLRPGLRQRLWQDALQTARLDNAGSDVAAQWFAGLCRMMVVGHAPRGGVDETTRRILQFAEEKCRSADHDTRVTASALYEAFTLWWCSRYGDPVPSQQMFGRVMSGRYMQRNRGGKSYYWGLRLAA
ncbi:MULTISPECIES: BRO-N domain-containing protein [Desulfovibrio]|uniref:BRO-N domain-containing protein n=1 Tax=Desulfovibrio TaxID=872 RepID=UPI001C00E6F6|nr:MULTISPECIES: Bro-N domain-containing protein [Desulfovibrio]MBT9749875.1 hypothetical protein [Desulfovibrio desulfuricans]HZF61951.1 Bro-N domain-containing protein [Desulfovibrio sp.]